MNGNKLDTIYSENFKRWFGDWENDPQNASKVVDSNGKPLPVFHGTTQLDGDGKPFRVFKVDIRATSSGQGAMFSDSQSVASFFSGGGHARFDDYKANYEKLDKTSIKDMLLFLRHTLDNNCKIVKVADLYRLEYEYGSAPLGETEEEVIDALARECKKTLWIRNGYTNDKPVVKGGIYKVYLNIRHPYIFDAKGSTFYALKTEFYNKPITANDLAHFVIESGKYDGVIIKNVRETTYSNVSPSTDYIVFKPNQIKHALDNNGNFNPDMDDMTENKIRIKESTLRNVIRQVVCEALNEVRYIDTRGEKYNGKVYKNHWSDIYTQEPITDDSRIRVFHGCELKTACDIAINGTSGRTYHPRQYSYESGMNPLGIFVTTDFETAKKFGVSNSGMAIIEFTAKGSDLESPIWNGQGSYFGQGTNPIPFKNGEERNAQKMQYRQDALNTEDDYYYDDKHRRREISMNHVRNSDKPEMADRIFNNTEHQALFMGDLNPNMIKRIWVKLPHEDGYVHSSDNYQPMSVREFLKRFKDKEWYEYRDFNGNERYSKIRKEKLFYPNEDVKSFDDVIDRVWKMEKQYYDNREDVKQNLEDWGMLQNPPSDNAYDIIKDQLWPKQIIQLYGQDYFNNHFNRLGQ